MADLEELRRIAKSNGYYHHIEPFDAEIERLRAALRNIEHQCYDGDPVKTTARAALAVA